MKFQTITIDTAMSKMSEFIAQTSEHKIAYCRKRSLVILGEDLSDYSDESMLESLVSIESRMQLYIDQYRKVQGKIPAGTLLNKDLVAKTDEFFNVAVPAGIASLIQALKSDEADNEELNKVINLLFKDRKYLCEQLEHMYSVVKNPEPVCDMIFLDHSTYNEVFHPVMSQLGTAPDVPFALALQSFLGMDAGMLLHETGLGVNERFTPKVPGFTNEFYMYLVLHELSHLLIYSDDTASALAGKLSASEFDVYSTATLTGENPHNADSYSVLILNALALLHRDGRIDLRNY